MKKQTKYKVLHIPTASYLFSYSYQKKAFHIVIFANKARAGHGMFDYINQTFTIRPYEGYGLYTEADILAVPGQNPWSISQQVKEIIKKHGKFNKAEFEFVPVEDNEDNEE